MNPNTYRALGLSDEEYQKILELHGREPTPTELAMFSVEWSEHCGYMCSRPHLSKFPKTGGKYPSLVGEDSGGVVVGDYAIIFKVESHNHPSEIIGFHGAATGVGGIIRDIFTAGARPIAVLDSLRFGDLSDPKVRHTMNEVIRGISHYGNCVGVPTVGGEINSDPSYNGNCLVNVMCIGICRKEELQRAIASGAGNSIMYVGAATGPDGIGGCSVLASQEFDEDDSKRPSVQIGDPFLEKCLIEATLELLKTGHVVGIKDMGAAGLTCSLVEMAAAAGVGINADLDKVPLRKDNMEPWEIMMSESQERMLVCIQEGHEQEATDIFTKWGLHAVVIGTVVNEDKVELSYKGDIVASVSAQILTNPPTYNFPSETQIAKEMLYWGDYPDRRNHNKNLTQLLAVPTIASKHAVYEQYDYAVQTNTVIPPGSGDAAVLRIKGTDMAIAATTDCNSTYCKLSPYLGSYLAVYEAARNLLCVGADPIAVTDGLNFGNPKKLDRFSEFAQSVQGISDACKRLGVPVVSGNVSFYNENPNGPINPTPIIGMIGIVKEARQAIQQFFVEKNNAILVLGSLIPDKSYCEYLKVVHGVVVGNPPVVVPHHFDALHQAMQRLVRKELIKSAHDCSEGGLAVALAECCFGPNVVGAQVKIDNGDERHDLMLFSEAQNRIIVSCDPMNVNPVMQVCIREGIDVNLIGWTGGKAFEIIHNGEQVIDHDVELLKRIWESGLTCDT